MIPVMSGTSNIHEAKILSNQPNNNAVKYEATARIAKNFSLPYTYLDRTGLFTASSSLSVNLLRLYVPYVTRKAAKSRFIFGATPKNRNEKYSFNKPLIDMNTELTIKNDTMLPIFGRYALLLLLMMSPTRLPTPQLIGVNLTYIFL